MTTQSNAGFDADLFPGADVMEWLRANTNLVWCGYYLAPAPSHALHPTSAWMGTRASLVALGWGIAPVYVGQQLRGPGSHVVTGAQGAVDGQDAVALMRQEGFPAGSCLYLDLENGAPLTTEQQAYLVAWCGAVGGGEYAPGVYCSHGIADAVAQAVPTARIWAFKVTTVENHAVPGTEFPNPAPSGSGFAAAEAWQLQQNCTLTIGVSPGTLLADLSSAVREDPGAP